MDNLKIVFDQIKPLMSEYVPPLVETSNYESRYELYTDRSVIIAGRRKPNLAFSALIIQSKYVGFYLMPVYTDVDILNFLPLELLHLKKGKSCFHLKKTSLELIDQVRDALKIGFERYRDHGWV